MPVKQHLLGITDTRTRKLIYEYTPTYRRNVDRPKKDVEAKIQEWETSLAWLMMMMMMIITIWL